MDSVTYVELQCCNEIKILVLYLESYMLHVTSCFAHSNGTQFN